MTIGGFVAVDAVVQCIVYHHCLMSPKTEEATKDSDSTDHGCMDVPSRVGIETYYVQPTAVVWESQT